MTAANEPLRAEELRDALHDVLYICEGGDVPLTPTEKVAAIKSVAMKALENDRG